jgi:hypothetical protein
LKPAPSSNAPGFNPFHLLKCDILVSKLAFQRVNLIPATARYGPKYSPHDVPSFYDVSGITENPEVFQMVVDFFVERYRSQGAEVGGCTQRLKAPGLKP